MKLNEAIVKRIEEICTEQNSNVCDICLKGGMSPSAIYDLVKGRTKCSKVITTGESGGLLSPIRACYRRG